MDVSHPDPSAACISHEADVVKRLARGHYLAGKRAAVWESSLGVSSTVLTAVAGTSVFASLANEDPGTPATVLVGLVTVLAAVLAGIRTAGKYAERAEKHKIGGARFDELSAELIALRLRIDRQQPADSDDRLTELISKRARLSGELPDLKDTFYDRARGQEE